jgi:hypothetical protein
MHTWLIRTVGVLGLLLNMPSTATAISQYRPLAKLGTLASAMGKTSAEFNQGLYTGHRYTHGAGDLLNPHAQRIVAIDGACAIAQRRRAVQRVNAPRQQQPPP